MGSNCEIRWAGGVKKIERAQAGGVAGAAKAHGVTRKEDARIPQLRFLPHEFHLR